MYVCFQYVSSHVVNLFVCIFAFIFAFVCVVTCDVVFTFDSFQFQFIFCAISSLSAKQKAGLQYARAQVDFFNGTGSVQTLWANIYLWFSEFASDFKSLPGWPKPVA